MFDKVDTVLGAIGTAVMVTLCSSLRGHVTPEDVFGIVAGVGIGLRLAQEAKGGRR